ncbi:mechanosensitive ion channel protein MscS [Actinorhabdospora filicis]|uniref:Mechanosensitive ion channel protein MscS n=1 Tax=Actinorhabdospora filicis TaxID=1785913 RepID=A0A9W6SQM8_9ACTN|nr:mechanosensitive ion channel domain-containing protein [Actinorhabdospora filicis]GLZ80491.1 mechanosensitive ion channel protein MscS [Actinorhabdospora filicis]
MSQIAEFAVGIGLVLVACAIAVALVTLTRWTTKRYTKPESILVRLVDDVHVPLSVTLSLIGAQLLLPLWWPWDWRAVLDHIVVLATFAAVAWLAIALLHVVEELIIRRVDKPGESAMERRRRTQVLLFRRVSVALIIAIALGAGLLTFPTVRTIGMSVLASAGIVGIVLGLAAQSWLKGIFAGLQLAFGDALRIGDVVVVEGEWGHVEEITLTYVVVRIWDKRRLVLPTTYFTENPYHTWTRSSVDILGTVELDVDFTLPLEPVREELQRLARECEYWDGDTCTLQVTDAVGGVMRLRAVVSAADGSVVWDLRCHIREGLLTWIRANHPDSLPKTRAELMGERPL